MAVAVAMAVAHHFYRRFPSFLCIVSVLQQTKPAYKQTYFVGPTKLFHSLAIDNLFILGDLKLKLIAYCTF